ncbi:MAG TPA: fumarylacetoacetate hydrolase family protein [Acidobacteriaceae bacterium]|nr:fumarylacetoacetate hydrolase family protein [Acidobacteriaceae bacterium]
MILYRMADGWMVEEAGRFNPLEEKSLDELLAREDLEAYLASHLKAGATEGAVDEKKLLAPVGTQEVWAAGVTYLRSRAARMEESKDAGGGDFYDRVYSAERPELFFKALAHKVVGPGAAVGIRSDATWNVPEPELALVINAAGKIVGATIGNDMSSRDIEGQNPLYLPQAKVYNRSCALGPGILVTSEALPVETRILVIIERGAVTAFAGETSLAQMKRKPQELVEYLYRDQTFPTGAFLLTGTGVVPPDSFTLKRGDSIRIAIDGIGELVNPVG